MHLNGTPFHMGHQVTLTVWPSRSDPPSQVTLGPFTTRQSAALRSEWLACRPVMTSMRLAVTMTIMRSVAVRISASTLRTWPPEWSQRSTHTKLRIVRLAQTAGLEGFTATVKGADPDFATLRHVDHPPAVVGRGGPGCLPVRLTCCRVYDPRRPLRRGGRPQPRRHPR
jgi:hypothetical protein